MFKRMDKVSTLRSLVFFKLKKSMLNISPNSTKQQVEIRTYQSFTATELPASNKLFRYWLIGTFLVLVAMLFLPWTQNIQTKGKITTLDPDQRPQNIETTIAGRIEKWYVQEGQFVAKGDTIAFLSEIKTDYFDKDLVNRTKNQVEAKQAAGKAYTLKAQALDNQVLAMRQELELKKQQLKNKVIQTQLKIKSLQAGLEQVKVDKQVAIYQFNRTDTLYQKGIKSLSDLEGKQLKVQETTAKVIAAQNKLEEAQNDLEINQLDFDRIENEYANKIAKAKSDKYTALSAQYDATGSINKLENQYQNYLQRASFYYITAPQDCFINQVIKKGIGETVKAGDALISTTPANLKLAVELYVRPMDLPLIETGQEVRFIFDGWPAFIFSGWPGLSFGTYDGKVAAIDNNISKNGKYRILVNANQEKAWPKALRIGSGAQGVALLNTVPVWYEVWRQANGFPPDFYDENTEKVPKMKAPIKSLK